MTDLDNTRRLFLGGTAASIAALGAFAVFGPRLGGADDEVGNDLGSGKIVVVNGSAVAPPAAPDPAEFARWSGALGATLTLASATGALSATLAEVVEQAVASPRPAGLRQRPFSVIWTLDHGAVAQDGLYRFQHPKLDVTTMFATAAGHRAGKAVLIAIFN